MTETTPIEKLLAALPRARRTPRGWSARCPAHEDSTPSLSLRETSDGTVLIRCFAGCSAEAICRSIGLDLRDLFSAHIRRPKATAAPKTSLSMSRSQIEAFYRQTLEEGRAERLADEPWGNPEHTVDDQNRARRKTNVHCRTTFAQLKLPWWVEYPHAHDGAWKSCVDRAVDELAWSHDVDPETLPRCIGLLPKARAAVMQRAAEILHEIGRAPE